MSKIVLALVPVALLAALSCSSGSGAPAVDGTGGGDPGSGTNPAGHGTLEILATDAPLDHRIVADARIGVDRIQVQDEVQGGFRTLYDGPPIRVDLLDLRNGLTQALLRASLPAGTYRQFRLRFDNAYLELVNGRTYTSADGTLKLNSQSTSGLKVFVDPPINVVAGISRSLLLDFELTKTFRPIPSNDPQNASRYRLAPVIRASNLSVAGELRGRVTDLQGAAVAGATVYILPPGEQDPNNSIATGGTMTDGRYAIIGLMAGEYDVLAVFDMVSGRVNGNLVSAGNITVADIVVQ